MFQRNFLNQEIKTISTIVLLIFLRRIHFTSISLKLEIDYFTCRNSCFQKLHEINSSRNANLLNYFLGDFSTQKQLAQKVKEKYIGRGRNKKENTVVQKPNNLSRGCWSKIQQVSNRNLPSDGKIPKISQKCRGKLRFLI